LSPRPFDHLERLDQLVDPAERSVVRFDGLADVGHRSEDQVDWMSRDFCQELLEVTGRFRNGDP